MSEVRYRKWIIKSIKRNGYGNEMHWKLIPPADFPIRFEGNCLEVSLGGLTHAKQQVDRYCELADKRTL